MDQYLVPMILAASSLPAFMAAALIARSARRSAMSGAPGGGMPGLARLMVMVGLAIVAGAIGLVWAGDNDTRRLAVIVAMVLAVNGLGIVLLVGMARSRRR